MRFHVVMPIGRNPNREIFQVAVADIARELGIVPHFPTYLPDDGAFNLQLVLADLRRSDFVLADVSLERPSCYYEIGLAEALDKPVFLIATEGTDIHQTSCRKAIQYYRDLDELTSLLLEVLTHAARVCASNAPK